MTEGFDFNSTLAIALPHARKILWKSVRDEITLDDLMQDTAIKALRWQSGFTPNPKLVHQGMLAWLARIALNTKRSDWRQATDRKTFPTDPSDFAFEVPVNPTVEVREELRLTIAAIQTLPAQAQEILNLCMLGYTTEEQSQHLGLPLGTVKSRASRARTLLAEAIGQPRVWLKGERSTNPLEDFD